MRYEPVIGLEIHVELKTATKMFCASANDPDETHPNTNVCPVCLGHPGTLPTINKTAIETLIRAGLALNCSIAPFSKFDRKNYFYPDLPKGYQISQYDLPLCSNGKLVFGDKTIRIQRIHMEEDTGRLSHSPDGAHTLVDYNRAGVPLMELVTEPDFTDGEQIMRFAKELQLILRYIGASDANMEKGQMRVEVNVSVRPQGSKTFGTKVEVKNINSISAAAKAADYEIERQSNVLNDGGKIIQETRGWNENTGKTISQRIKEGSADYRYFPEPDLPPLRFSEETISEIQSTLPELPEQRRQRFAKEYELNTAIIEVFTTTKYLGDYFERVASELLAWDRLVHLDRPASEHTRSLFILTANFIVTEFPPLFQNIELKSANDIYVPAESLAEIIVRLFHKQISSTAAKTILGHVFESGRSVETIITEENLLQVSNSDELLEVVDKIIAENPKAVQDYTSGKTEVVKFMVGKAMAATKGKGNPQVLLEIFENKLKNL